MKIITTLLFISTISFTSKIQHHQEKSNSDHTTQKHHAFDKYWKEGKAEVSSYKLEQARYGEIHEGTASLIFVTEPFSPHKFVKSDQQQKTDISVLKLNQTKKFTTGIYPYSMMTSSFFPVDSAHSIKISSSSQEWCGHTYMEMKNKKLFEFNITSYFENESRKQTVDKALLEDDFWTKLRISPNSLPKGKVQIIPSFFYLRLMHQELKAYDCIITHIEKDNVTSTYRLYYPELQRDLRIDYETIFPHKIFGWQETYYSGFDKKRKKLTTTATHIKTLKTDYWNKNSTKDSKLRKELKLD